MSEQRIEACATLLRQVRTIVDTDGTGDTALETIKQLLVGLANRGEALFPLGDFAMPAAHGRNHILALEDDDGMGLYSDHCPARKGGRTARPRDLVRERRDLRAGSASVLSPHR